MPISRKITFVVAGGEKLMAGTDGALRQAQNIMHQDV